MTNYDSPGEIVKLTAPSGGVVAGLGYKIGSLVVVATHAAAQTLPFSAFVGPGVVTVVKDTGGAWSEGQKIYWDNTDKVFTDDSSTHSPALVGVAAEAALQAATTGKVRLDGVVR